MYSLCAQKKLCSVKHVLGMRSEKVIQCNTCFCWCSCVFWFRIVAQNRNSTTSNIAKLFPSYLVMCSSNTMLDMWLHVFLIAGASQAVRATARRSATNADGATYSLPMRSAVIVFFLPCRCAFALQSRYPADNV